MGDLWEICGRFTGGFTDGFAGNWIEVRLKLDSDIPGVYYIIKVESRNICPICLKHQ